MAKGISLICREAGHSFPSADISLHNLSFLLYNQFDKLEFGGESLLTIRYGQRRQNHTIGPARLFTISRSAYGIPQT